MVDTLKDAVVSSFGKWDKKRWLRNPRNLNLLVIGVVVMAIGLFVAGIGGYHYWQSRRLHDKKLTGLQLATTVNDLFSQKKYSDARTVIQSSPTAANDKESLLLLADSYLGQGKYLDAENTFKQVEQKHGLDESTAVNIASAAQKAGDKQTSVVYYQKAIDILQTEKGVPNVQTQIKDLQTVIEQIKSGTGF